MIIKPLLVQVALLSERNTGWLEGTVCKVVEDGKYYQLQTGSFVEITEATLNKLYARIDDTKGDGDTTYTWSADKVFDQLALKQNLITSSGCRVRLTGDQTISNTTYTKMAFATEDWDLNTEYDNVTNYRFTAKQAGYYAVTINLNITDLASSKQLQGHIYKNGAEVSYMRLRSHDNVQDPCIVLSDVVYLNGSTDYIEGYIYHNHGSARTAPADATFNYMTIHKLL